MRTKQLIVVAVLFLVACTKEEITPRDYPRVMTREVANLASGTATFVGEITFASVPIVDHGFIWTTAGFPTLTNGTKKSLGAKTGAGTFVFTVAQGLVAGKKYSMCAYAISSKDIVYGKTFDFVGK